MVPYLRSFEVKGIKETSIEVTIKMKVEGVNFEITIIKVMVKNMILEGKGREELGIKKAVFEAMDKMIFEVMCLETLGKSKKVAFVKDMAMFFEAKGEAKNLEVIGPLEELVKSTNEVVRFNLLDTEVTSFEAKDRLILEVVHFEVQEEKGIEETIFEEVSMMMIKRKKELINKALDKKKIIEEKGQDECWRFWGRLPRSLV